MISPICILRTITLTLGRAVRAGDFVWVSGHAFVEQPAEKDQACCIQILKCDACSHVSTAWRACSCKSLRRLPPQANAGESCQDR